MSIGIIGRKIGMTRVYDAGGRLMPVTVIAAEGNTLLQRKTIETDGYEAVQLGYHTQKEQRVSKGELGHFKKTGSEPKKAIREFRPKVGATLEAEINVGVTQFAVGQYVDVSGRSKGKGFMGVMRKHNFDGQGAAHGMPGHMGDKNCTTQNLVVQQVRENENVLLITGAIPGAKGCYVEIRPAIKKSQEVRDLMGLAAPKTDAKPVNPAKKNKK